MMPSLRIGISAETTSQKYCFSTKSGPNCTESKASCECVLPLPKECEVSMPPCT